MILMLDPQAGLHEKAYSFMLKDSTRYHDRFLDLDVFSWTDDYRQTGEMEPCLLVSIHAMSAHVSASALVTR